MSSDAMSPNHREAIVAVSSITGKVEYVFSTNHALDVSGGGSGGGDVQYTTGTTTPSPAVGTLPVFDNNGTITGVSVANPLPVNASVTITGVSTASNQTSGAQKTQIVDGSGNIISSTSNALNVSAVQSGTWNITNISGSISLPTGASTSALQTTGNTSLATIATNTGTTPSLPTVIRNNQQTATTSAVALSSGALTVGVIIEALSTNTTSVFIGGTGVTVSTGIELLPGASTSVAVSNTSTIFIVSSSGSPAVSWIGS